MFTLLCAASCACSNDDDDDDDDNDDDNDDDDDDALVTCVVVVVELALAAAVVLLSEVMLAFVFNLSVTLSSPIILEKFRSVGSASSPILRISLSIFFNCAIGMLLVSRLRYFLAATTSGYHSHSRPGY